MIYSIDLISSIIDISSLFLFIVIIFILVPSIIFILVPGIIINKNNGRPVRRPTIYPAGEVEPQGCLDGIWSKIKKLFK